MNKQFVLKRYIFPILIFVLAVVIFAALSFFKPTKVKPPVSETMWPVAYTTARYETLTPQLQLYGKIDSLNQSKITAAITANVKARFAHEGSYVKAGDVILELDDTEQQLSLMQQQADIKELEAAIVMEKNNFETLKKTIKNEKAILTIQSRNLEREETLKKKNLSSDSVIDQKRLTVEQQQIAYKVKELNLLNYPVTITQLEAKLERLDAQRKLSELDLARTKIIAPFNARISTMHVSVGERVRIGDPIVNLYDIDNLEIRAQIPELYLSTIKKALAAQGALNARILLKHDNVPLNLIRLAGQVKAGQGGQDGIFTLGHPDQTIPLGKTVKVQLDLPALPHMFAIENNALYGVNRVYKVSDNRLEGIELDIFGKRQREDGQEIVIASSDKLLPNDIYITTQLPNAINGLKITLRDMATPSDPAPSDTPAANVSPQAEPQ